MKIKIENYKTGCEALLPPAKPDKSGVGVNYVDACIKELNKAQSDGINISIRRKGLRLTLNIGDNSGDALLRKFDHGPGERLIFYKAMEGAALKAGYHFSMNDTGDVYLEPVALIGRSIIAG